LVDITDCSYVISAFQGISYEDAVDACPRPCDPAEAAAVPWRPKNPYYFTGRRLDFNIAREQTGGVPPELAGDPLLTLYHYRARAYDPTHGRFLQRDPAGYVDGMSLYEGIRSVPTQHTDPSGLLVQELYHLFASGRFLSNEEIERSFNQGIELVHVESKLLTDLHNAAEYFFDPRAKLLLARGIMEGYFLPAIESTTDRFTSVVNSQVEAGVPVSVAASNTRLTTLFFGDMFGVTQAGEVAFGVDLATNAQLPASELVRRGVQGGSQLFIFVAVPQCPRATSGLLGRPARVAVQPSAKLPLLTRILKPPARFVLQRLLRRANRSLGKDLQQAKEVLTRDAYTLGQQEWAFPMQYGNALHNTVGLRIEHSTLLSRMFNPGGIAGRGPDIRGIGLLKGLQFDITTTTPRVVAEHLARPYGPDLIVITYQRPINLTRFP
jgi:RHS repeat-associated protein